MIMFGITSFMFALGIITLVLETTVEFQYILLNSDPLKLAIISTVWATITRLMVRPPDASMPSACPN